jgi:hypothetical protein
VTSGTLTVPSPDDPSAAQLATYQLYEPSGMVLVNWPNMSCANGQLFVVGPANGSVTVQSRLNKN